MRPDSSPQSPRVSIVIAAYNSHATIARCLGAIEQQTWRDFETIVVDSSAGEETAGIVRQMFPAVHLVRSETRLYPQGARNRGVAVARGDLLVFTDSHMYPHPDWLERLVAAHDSHGAVVVGAIACHGARLFDRGVHLCKFAKWLPCGARREIDMSPAGNMLLRRESFELAGGFTWENFLGDVIFSRALRASGISLVFEPGAVVEHHHEHTLRSFLKERFERGMVFGGMRSQWLGNRAQVLGYLIVTILPLRLIRIAAIVARQAARSPMRWLMSYPVAMLGHAASLAGESLAYARVLKTGPRELSPRA